MSYMTDYTPEFLAHALAEYMDSFEVLQEDHSTYDPDTHELEGALVLRHVFVGDEIPSMQGFSVKTRIPIRKLQGLYNEKVLSDPNCPWVGAVEIFKAFMETTIASAAAFNLINASFAKDMMKQWLGWKTDTILIDDDSEAKAMTSTEAANRIHTLIANALEANNIAIPAPEVIDVEATKIADSKGEAVAVAAQEVAATLQKPTPPTHRKRKVNRS